MAPKTSTNSKGIVIAASTAAVPRRSGVFARLVSRPTAFRQLRSVCWIGNFMVNCYLEYFKGEAGINWKPRSNLLSRPWDSPILGKISTLTCQNSTVQGDTEVVADFVNFDFESAHGSGANNWVGRTDRKSPQPGCKNRV